LDANSSYQFNIAVDQAATFPWLSEIAAYFDQYRLHRVSFELNTASPTTVGGSVVIAYDPNSTDVPPATFAGYCSIAYKQTMAPWEDGRLEIPAVQLARSPGPYRFTHTNASSDPLLSSVGQLLVTSESPSTYASFARLYISYDVELLNPQPLAALTGLTPDQFPSFKLPNRNAATSLWSGRLLSTEQFNLLHAYLDSSTRGAVTIEADQTNVDRDIANANVVLPTLRFSDPGEYLVELSNLLFQTGGHNTVPNLLNWTKNVEILGTQILGIDDVLDNGITRDTSLSTDYFNSAMRVWLRVKNAVSNPGWSRPFTGDHPDGSDEKGFGTIALGLWNTYAGGIPANSASSLASYAGSVFPFLNIIRSPRMPSGLSSQSSAAAWIRECRLKARALDETYAKYQKEKGNLTPTTTTNLHVQYDSVLESLRDTKTVSE